MGNRFVDGSQALVSRHSCDEDLTRAVEMAVDAIGGFDRLVEAGDTILLAPNVNTADPPPGSSDPLFVRTVIERLYDHGAAQVILGGSTTFMLPSRRTMKKAGILRVAQEAGAEVVVFDEEEWVKVEVGGRYLKTVRLARAVLEAPKIVYVCCLKTHFATDFTMSLKLGMGFVKPRDRMAMHRRRLREKLADLNLVLDPDLIVMDARRCFISGGPAKGVLREPNLIMASGDRIALDVEGIKVIQGYPGHELTQDPWEFTMIRQAVALGLGAENEDAYRVVT